MNAIETIAVTLFFAMILAGILTMATRKTGKQDSPEVKAFEAMAKWYYYLTRSNHE